MKGILKSKRYTETEKNAITKALGHSPAIEDVMSKRDVSRTFLKDTVLCEDFSRYLSDVFHFSCRRLREKTDALSKRPENPEISKFIAESYGTIRGNMRGLYFTSLINSLINADADQVIERIVKFDPKSEESIAWMRSIKLPAGSPAVAMLSHCVKDFGFRFPVGEEIDVYLNPKMTASMLDEHWIFKSSPLGMGSVSMILAASKFNNATKSI